MATLPDMLMANEAGLPRDAAEEIKAAALRLFAEHGASAVTVRQIALAAGQRNHAAVGYHFGSKEALLQAVIAHGAQLIDDVRNAMLDEIEAAGGPTSVLQLAQCLVRSSLPRADPPWSDCYNRFIVGLQLSNRALFMDALEGRWNSGYLRCLAHFRRLLPQLPPATANQRLLFMGAALGGILAARERELADQSRPHAMWGNDATLDEVAQALVAILERPAGNLQPTP